MNTPLSRRAALAGALRAVPALAGAAVIAGPPLASAASPDPIFAAIEEHKRAWRMFSDSCDLTDDVRAEDEGRVVTEADEAAYEAANDAEYEARDALFQTPAETVAGLRAFIEHYIEHDAGLMDEVTSAFLASVLESPVLALSTSVQKVTP